MSELSSTMTYSLKELLAHLSVLNAIDERQITGLAIDSRQVKPGYLFIACIGKKVDGRAYIKEALEKGAAAILCDAIEDNVKLNEHIKSHDGRIVPVIYLADLGQKVGYLAHQFYQKPSEKMQIIAVTGTNGKTSISHFMANMLVKSGKPCGVIGTLGNGFLSQLKSGVYTTPNSLDLHQTLRDLYQQGAAAIAMEASSHGLHQGRMNGAKVDIAIFTNLTHDHLDYHGSMEKYGQAKKRLFETPGLKYAIINADDAYGVRLINEFKTKLPVYAYSLHNTCMSVPLIKATGIQMSNQGIEAWVESPWGNGLLTTRAWGRFNLSNFLAVLAGLCLLGLPFNEVLAYISEQKEVKGRMETFGGEGKPTVIVDFAHTPDALENVLFTVKQQCQGQLICVFGCGGDRDRSKRIVMGDIAQKYSDYIIVTNDNPRGEAPELIAAAIVEGIKNKAHLIELDRKKAIMSAINNASSNDVVVIAGKGHEMDQQIGAMKYPFSDQEVVNITLNQLE